MPKKEPCHANPMDEHDRNCRFPNCFLCLMKESNPVTRRLNLSKFFRDLPSQTNEGPTFALRGLWSTAMAYPNDPDLVEAGVFECMAFLISKSINDRRWLLQHQNIAIPYYAAHVIGSYTMNMGDFAVKAVKEGVIPPLLELLRGRLTWVEQRVAVRALGHIATYDRTFPAVAAYPELLELAMELAVSSLEIVYTNFIQSGERRLRYHCELLTRGMGGRELESRKGEEWASQLQCWSLQLINCFAFRERYLSTICRNSFLAKLQHMWGGLVNENSPAGVGLLRTICHHKFGRSSIAGCPSVIEQLCNVARSSDDWRNMAVDCLLLLLQDARTRRRVMDIAAVALVDLAELPSLGDRKNIGNMIGDVLLQGDTQSPSAFLRSSLSTQSRHLLDELAVQRQRMKWEQSLPKEDLLLKQHAVLAAKLEGNARFAAGDVVGAVSKYTEALALCPVRSKRERVVLHSNRAQCHLLLQDPKAAISDTTRALCLHKPLNCHGKSLWRRAQAYDLMGLAKESLLDAIMFMNECSHMVQAQPGLNQPTVPDYAERLVAKQMKATWLFREAALRHGGVQELEHANEDGYMETREEEDEDSEWETASESDIVTGEATEGRCTKDKDNSELQSGGDEKRASLQRLASSLQGLDLKTGANHSTQILPTIKEESFSEGELNHQKLWSGKHEKDDVALDRELLKQRIYDLIHQAYSLEKGKGTKKATKGGETF